MSTRAASLAVLSALTTATSRAQTTAPLTAPVLARPLDAAAIRLPLRSPGATACAPEQWFSWRGETNVRNVGRPTLLPILPTDHRQGRTAIVIAAGGGFTGLRYEAEGLKLAERLRDRGVAAFVLKYRTRCTPADLPVFARSLTGGLAGDTATASGDTEPSTFDPAYADARTAIEMVRQNAATYGVAPDRIGIAGFSAGAITALHVAGKRGDADVPDFIVSIYGPTRLAIPVSQRPAPLFVAIATDDRFFGRQSLQLIHDWEAAGGSVELHRYPKGGHGFAFRHQGTSSDHWFETLSWWLEAQGLIAVRP